MADSIGRNIRLGVFVIVATGLLIAGLYFIGNQRNLFGSTFQVSAQFKDVQGLMRGHNVRFAGIDVGTVERVDILNDSIINVVMIIDTEVQPYIRKNALASIGTDGLMGNKLVNISPVSPPSGPIQEGDVLRSVHPLDTDDMIRTLNKTNENILVISQNLRSISQRFREENMLWDLLTDTIVAENMKLSAINIRHATARTSKITADLQAITDYVRGGNGALGELIRDTTIFYRADQILVHLQGVSDTISVIANDLSTISGKIKRGEGTVGTLVHDTTLVDELHESLEEIQEGAKGFKQNMEALKHSWPFKRYYRKKRKEEGEREERIELDSIRASQ